MGHLLRANTAVDVLIGPFVDNSNGDTDETGLTITQADIRLSKNGQNMAQKNDANACAHDEIGYYNCPLDATDTNTEGQLDIMIHESGALHSKKECSVISEAAWDSLFVEKDAGFMDVNIKTVGRADAQETEANNLESACSNYSATRGLTGTALPAAAANASGGVPISDDGGVDLDELYDAIVTDAAGTNIAVDIVALQAVVGALDDAAAAGEVTEADTLVQYIKQLLNVLIGGTGIVAWPAAAAPANGVSIAEGLRGLYEDRTLAGADYTVVGDTIAGVTTVNGLAANVITATAINADAITAAKVAADVHTEGATAVWDSSNGTLTKAYSLIMEQIYQFLHNDMNITDATGAVALRNLANDGDMATWGITDNDTTTARTDVVWS